MNHYRALLLLFRAVCHRDPLPVCVIARVSLPKTNAFSSSRVLACSYPRSRSLPLAWCMDRNCCSLPLANKSKHIPRVWGTDKHTNEPHKEKEGKTIIKMEDDWKDIGKNTTTTQRRWRWRRRERERKAAHCQSEEESKHIVHALALLVHVQLSNNLHNLNSFFFFFAFDKISNGFNGCRQFIFFCVRCCCCLFARFGRLCSFTRFLWILRRSAITEHTFRIDFRGIPIMTTTLSALITCTTVTQMHVPCSATHYTVIHEWSYQSNFFWQQFQELSQLFSIIQGMPDFFPSLSLSLPINHGYLISFVRIHTETQKNKTIQSIQLGYWLESTIIIHVQIEIYYYKI